MFTLTDIRDIAIQIERNGEQTYRQAAANIDDPEISKILLWMADEEERHAAWFAQFQASKQLSEAERQVEEMGRKLLQDMVQGQTFSLEGQELQETSSIDQVVQQSIGFEQDTVLFYEFLLSLIEDNATKKHLEAIIGEEKRHHNELKKLQSQL
ncbi:ferritin family protein [Desulfogranum japonicum]|uniref:ferritin family protein n=1 Tax=Desulfogranum japonicum TaxID=231447 RepID=UPI00041E239E|nr:ferritin family protein [Desulfogranum japonicum]